MNKTSTFVVPGILILFVTAIFSFSGCAIETPQKPSGIEQKIQNARTPVEHEVIASQYEKQAEADKTTARLHHSMAEKYQYYAGPKGNTPGAFAGHCESLAKIYQQAADENLELAKLHRQAAIDAK